MWPVTVSGIHASLLDQLRPGTTSLDKLVPDREHRENAATNPTVWILQVGSESRLNSSDQMRCDRATHVASL